MPRALHRRLLLLTLALSALGPQAARAKSPALRQLLTAARRGDLPALHAALAAGADPRRKAPPDGQQALHWAAVAGSADAIRAPLAAGVVADVRDGLKATPLDHALTAGQPDAVTALLAGGADPAALDRSIAFRIGPALNPDTLPGELEALRRAIRSGHGLELVRPDTGSGGSALTALAERAQRPGAERIAADLVTAGARLDARDAKGRTARQIVEQGLGTQRDARLRAQMERVLQVLRDAEARR